MSAPPSQLSSSLTNASSSSQSSLRASRSSNSPLHLSTSSLPPHSSQPAVVHSASPQSDESLLSDSPSDESPPDDVLRVSEDDADGVFNSLTESQFITHESAAEAAAAHSAATAPPRPVDLTASSSSVAPVLAAAAPTSTSASLEVSPAVSAAPSEQPATVAASVSLSSSGVDAARNSIWQSAIDSVQDRERAESTEALQPAAVPEAEQKEAAAGAAAQLSPRATGASTAIVAASDGAVGAPVDSSPSFYSRVTSLLSSFSSSPVLPGALLSISLLAVSFWMGRAYQRRQFSLAAQQHADTVHTYLAQQHLSALSSRPFSRGGSGSGAAGSPAGGLMETTRRLVSAILGEQEKEVGRWLGLWQDGLVAPVVLRASIQC